MHTLLYFYEITLLKVEKLLNAAIQGAASICLGEVLVELLHTAHCTDGVCVMHYAGALLNCNIMICPSIYLCDVASICLGEVLVELLERFVEYMKHF